MERDTKDNLKIIAVWLLAVSAFLVAYVVGVPQHTLREIGIHVIDVLPRWH
jgi:hypothetical protein